MRALILIAVAGALGSACISFDRRDCESDQGGCAKPAPDAPGDAAADAPTPPTDATDAETPGPAADGLTVDVADAVDAVADVPDEEDASVVPDVADVADVAEVADVADIAEPDPGPVDAADDVAEDLGFPGEGADEGPSEDTSGPEDVADVEPPEDTGVETGDTGCDECPAEGQVACSQAGEAIRRCASLDGCLVWGDDEPCPGVVCGDEPDSAPTNACTADGACVLTTEKDPTNPCRVCQDMEFVPWEGSCEDGNACTVFDTCQDGVCTPGSDVTCAAADACHEAGTCDPGSGACSNPAKADGTACDDGDKCTQSDTCQAGACSGANPVACAAKDGCHSVGTCDSATGTCSSPAKADGAACDDQDACTQTDTCKAGACSGDDPVQCPAPKACHEAGTCDSGTGMCTSLAEADGTACDDSNLCTQTDTCQGGTCTGASPVVCTAQDDCHDVGTCAKDTGLCSNPAKADGTSCDDNNLCTKVDACQGGKCTGVSPVACLASDQCHDAGTCDPGTGVCSNPAKPNGTTCTDNDKCTQTDTCQGGACTGANPVPCPTPDQCHVVGACDPATGACSNPPRTDGTTCDDNSQCTKTDTCQAGVCSGANLVVCAAKDGCHAAGACDPVTGACSDPARPDGTMCDDNSKCTQSDTCQGGACTGTNPIVCVAKGVCRAPGTCDPATGACSDPPASKGDVCDDGNACTAGDSCSGTGVCDPGTKPTEDTWCGVKDDPCAFNGLCKSGVCKAAEDLCKEERIDVGGQVTGGPTPAPTGGDRFVAAYIANGTAIRARGVHQGGSLLATESTATGPAFVSVGRAGSRPTGDAVIAYLTSAITTSKTVTQFHSSTNYLEPPLTEWMAFDVLLGSIQAVPISASGVAGAAVTIVGPFSAHIRTRLNYTGGVGNCNLTFNVTLIPRVEPVGLTSGFAFLYAAEMTVTGSAVPTPGGTGGNCVSMQTELNPDVAQQIGPAGILLPPSVTLGPGQPTMTPLTGLGSRFAAAATTWQGEEAILVAHQQGGEPAVGLSVLTPLGAVAAQTNLATNGPVADRIDLAVRSDGSGVVAYDMVDTVYAIRFKPSLDPLGTPIVVDGLAGVQRLADVAALPDGGAVVSFTDFVGDGSGTAARARYLPAGLVSLPAVFQINTATTGDQSSPGLVAYSGTSGFAAVFRDAAGAVWTRRFDAQGKPAAGNPERRASTTSASSQVTPGVASRADGAALIVWQSVALAIKGQDISGRVVGSDGAPLSQELSLSGPAAGDQVEPAVAATDEGWLAAWASQTSAGACIGVKARRIGTLGALLGSELDVGAGAAADACGHASVAARTGGDAFVMWSAAAGAQSQAVGRFVSAAGVVLGSAPIVLDTQAGVDARTAAAMTIDGTVAAVWEGPAGLRATVVQNGVPKTAASLTWPSPYTVFTSPGVAALDDAVLICGDAKAPNGTWSVLCNVWSLPDLSSIEVWLTAPGPASTVPRRPDLTLAGNVAVLGSHGTGFDASGSAVTIDRIDLAKLKLTGVTEVVNRFRDGNQLSAAVAGQADGGVMAVWQSDGQGAIVYRALPPP